MNRKGEKEKEEEEKDKVGKTFATFVSACLASHINYSFGH